VALESDLQRLSMLGGLRLRSLARAAKLRSDRGNWLRDVRRKISEIQGLSGNDISDQHQQVFVAGDRKSLERLAHSTKRDEIRFNAVSFQRRALENNYRFWHSWSLAGAPNKSNRNAYRRILLNLDFNNCSSTKNYLESILFWRRVCRQGMSL
jgi:hypothetical protein